MPVQSFDQLGPPDLVTPLTITDPNPTATAIWVPDDPTYGPTGLNPAKDYVIQFSGTNRIRGVQIINGRNVVLYGMRCKLTADNTICLFTGDGTSRIVHVQDYWVDPNNFEGDCFKTSGNSDNTIIQLKKGRCEKLLGSTDPGHVHADFLQTSGGFKELWVEDGTVTTAFDGLMLQREANCETMTSADFFNVTQLTKSGNIATATCPNHNFVVGEAVGIWGAATNAWNGGWTVLSVTGSGTTKKITFQLGDTLPANLGTGAATVAQIVRFAWGYKDGKIRINRFNVYGVASGNGLPPTTALQCIRFGARAAPQPNSSSNPVYVAGYTRINEDETPLTSDWWNGDMIALKWYASPPSGQTVDQFLEPDGNSANFSGMRPVLHTGSPNYADWPNATKVLNASRITQGVPSTGDFVTYNAGTGATSFGDPAGALDTGAPPPPPPPPPTGTYWDMDFGVNDPATTPFGFDLVPNAPDPVAGTIIEVVNAAPLGGTGKQIGIGIRSSTFSTSPYTTEKTNGVTKPGILGVLFNWYQWQPTQWNSYDNSVLAGLDTAVDLCATETAAGRPVKLILRMVNPPTGGTDIAGTQLPNWMIAAPGTLNNSRQVRCWDMITTDGGARNTRVPVYWDSTLTYNNNFIYHYTNALQTLNTYLNGTTSAGNRRANYVLHVPIGAGLSDSGSEMSLGMGSGAASFATPLTLNGVTYGNDTNGYPSISDISVVNRNSAKTLMPASVAADTQTAQDTWFRTWWHNLGSTAVGGLAPGDGPWMQMIAVAMAQANFDSSVAYGGIFNDGYAAANDMLARNAQYLKTKLWTGQTNLRVRPPGGDFGQPISTWTYRLWSSDAADLMIHALNLVSPARPLMWFQTAANVGQGGSRGCPPSDFQQSVAEAVNVYKVQEIETYAGIFTDATYGASNAAYANSQMANLQVNSDAVASGGATRGELHMKEVVAVTNGPIGRNNLPTGVTDVWFRFVMDNVTAPSATVTLHLSKSTGTTGDLAVRLDATKHLIGRWSGGAVDWTDTNVLQVGDVIDIRHVLNGATSGYEIWVNGTQRRKNLALSATAAATVQYGQLGLANAADVEGWFYRYGAAASRMGTPQPLAGASNGDAPVVTIVSPTNGTIYTTGGSKTVTVTASDGDGISVVEIRVDAGAWQAMTLSGSQYTASVSLTGTAGQSVSHVIDVRATDAFSDTTKRLQTIATTNTLVNVPGVDTTVPTLTVTTPATNLTVPNGTVTQVVAGTSSDDTGVTQLLVNGTLIATTGGAFSTTVPLAVGSNVITVVAKDAAGNQTIVTRTVTQQDVVIVSPPTVTLTAPAQGQAFPKGTTTLTLAGTASDPVAVVSVTYNIDGSSEVPLTLTSGAFSSVIGITPGNHTITVTATNNAGLTDQDARSVSVPLPDVQITDAASAGIQRGRVIVRA